MTSSRGRFIQYKRNTDGTIAPIGPYEETDIVIHHVYEGDMSLLQSVTSGTDLLFIDKENMETCENGNDHIRLHAVTMKENYAKTYALSHVIEGYANGWLVEEVRTITEDYPIHTYALLPLVHYGQFFEYTDFKEGRDYTKMVTPTFDGMVIDLRFRSIKMRESFTRLRKRLVDVATLQRDIDCFKRSSDVWFVHHPTGIGYAADDEAVLQRISGHVYDNLLIID